MIGGMSGKELLMLEKIEASLTLGRAGEGGVG